MLSFARLTCEGGRTPLLIVDEVGRIPFDPEVAALFFARTERGTASHQEPGSHMTDSPSDTFLLRGADVIIAEADALLRDVIVYSEPAEPEGEAQASDLPGSVSR